ncbi:MAG: hypothetical protein QXG05_07380 [Nitrososphaerota archaeon]
MSDIFQKDEFTAEELNRILPNYLDNNPAANRYKWKIVKMNTYISKRDGKQHTTYGIYSCYKGFVEDKWGLYGIRLDNALNMEAYNEIQKIIEE